MMYIKYFFFFKLWSFIIILSIHYDSINGEITSIYPNPIPILYPITTFKKPTKQLSDESRIEFQIRNHQGPGTYIFGFDTGHGKNRQYKIEERLRNGSVKGRYGFYDAKGKLKIINYIASPDGGYQEQHHETVIRKSKT